MSIVALQNIWEGLLAYNLTAANKRWLAERLLNEVEAEEAGTLQPYTMAEIEAMIAESEEDLRAGRFLSSDEAAAHRRMHMSKLLNQ